MRNKLFVLAAALTFVGAACPSKPTQFGTALSYCLHEANSWDEYEGCCKEVAKQFGRDPSFCMEDAAGLDHAPTASDGGL